MPYPTDAATEAAIAAGRIKSADLIDFYLKDGVGDPLTLRAWTWPGTASYPGTVEMDGSTANNDYTSLFGRVGIAKGLRMAASLASEPLRIQLDGSRSSDDADWVGMFVDADWHQMPIRVRQVMMDWDSEALSADPMWEWRGLLDHRELVEQVGSPSTWEVTCQGGLFRVRGRRLKTRTHEDQQRRSAGDMFYAGTPGMVGRPLNWAKKAGSVPGTATSTATSPSPRFMGGGDSLANALRNR